MELRKRINTIKWADFSHRKEAIRKAQEEKRKKEEENDKKLEEKKNRLE